MEILLLLRGRPDDAWTTEGIGRELNVPESVVRDEVEALCGQGLVELRTGAESRLYRFRPESPSLAHQVDRLAEMYRDKRLGVMKIMNANAIERVRSSAARTFADAFLLRRKKDPDG